MSTLGQMLAGELKARQSRNPRYSMRAFARDLHLSAGMLSRLMRTQKKVSFERTLELIARLHLDPASEDLLLKQAALDSIADPRVRALVSEAAGTDGREPSVLEAQGVLRLTIEQFRLMSEWQHAALVAMGSLDAIQKDPSWLASKLGIPVDTVKNSLQRLQQAGLLQSADGKLKETRHKTAILLPYIDQALVRFLDEMIRRGRKALQERRPEEFELSVFTGASLPVNPAQIPEARKRVRQFLLDLSELLKQGGPTEAYQLNVQLFSLTESPLQEP